LKFIEPGRRRPDLSDRAGHKKRRDGLKKKHLSCLPNAKIGCYEDQNGKLKQSNENEVHTIVAIAVVNKS
jgi:hypothetical protein